MQTHELNGTCSLVKSSLKAILSQRLKINHILFNSQNLGGASVVIPPLTAIEPVAAVEFVTTSVDGCSLVVEVSVMSTGVVVEPVSIGVVVEPVSIGGVGVEFKTTGDANKGSSSSSSITSCGVALQHTSFRLLGIPVQHISSIFVMLSMLALIA